MKKSYIPVLVAGLLFLGTGVFQEAKSSKTIGISSSELEKNSTNVESKSFAVDVDQSKVYWEGKKLIGGGHEGTINIKTGSLSVEKGEVTNGKFIIDLNTIDVTDLEGGMKERLIGHLKNPDFFDVANFPHAEFTIVSTKKLTKKALAAFSGEKKEKGYTHQVEGKLTIRGKSSDISFPASIHQKEGKIHASAQFSIDRTKYGISYHSEDLLDLAKDKMISNTVNVGFDLVAVSETL
ncbi:YceI family protein [Xanthovirga aplysinae]|uniref:YceI family protein n=1 Tax=Xanthovirga aplysinae TaxID=2529853 RepID=UPI0012BBB3C9|nr:YceI family protein [Xanthovirga aplysinae]MTI31173.1 YceI family protein [Xanthovirga aplysinae]